jgi:hypothetical protein
VTWAVEGALRWYALGFPPLPATVEASTREWRRQTDLILAYWDARLVADAEACVLTTELLQEFNNWLQDESRGKWAKEGFHPRFKGHAETKRHRVVEKRTMKLAGLSHPPGRHPPAYSTQPVVYMGVRFRAAVEEADGGLEEHGEVAEVADSPGTCTREASIEKVPPGSARSANRTDDAAGRPCCCDGGDVSGTDTPPAPSDSPASVTADEAPLAAADRDAPLDDRRDESTPTNRWQGRLPPDGDPPMGITKEAWARQHGRQGAAK